MTLVARELISELADIGVSLELGDGVLWLDPIEAVPDKLRERLAANKQQIIELLSTRISCQVQWYPDCAGPSAPTSRISPKRMGFTATSNQYAHACATCASIVNERGRAQNFDRENYLLWAVLRTQQLW